MADGYVCPECGLDYDTVSGKDAIVAVRSYPRRYREVLTAVAQESKLHDRPAPETWSAIEYTAHVADLGPVFTETVRAMRTGGAVDAGSWWDADERAAEQHYNDRTRDEVLDELQKAETALADELDKVTADQWSNTAQFPWGERDLLTMARNAVHEGSHHLRDVKKGLEQLK
jgi:hypothetical protein